MSRIDAAGRACRALVLDLETVYEVDTQGADTLATLGADLGSRGVQFRTARVHGDVLDYVESSGSLARLGERHGARERRAGGAIAR